jgi:hypothetical protein
MSIWKGWDLHGSKELFGEHHHVLLSIVLVLNEMVLVLVLAGAVRIE